jgi:glucokinase
VLLPVLGIDIGGTKTIVAVAEDDARIIGQARIDTPREEGPAAVLESIESALRRLLDEARAVQVDGIGIGCGGPLDPARGKILTAPNLPGWEDLPLADHFREAFGAPAYLDNDVTLAALGEAREGAGRGVDNFAYFNIGTGIGGGIIADGKVYRGCGNAGEFGHQIILPDGPPCLCGRRGCLESLASGTSISRHARRYAVCCPDSMMLRLAGDADSVTAEHAALAARDGDEVALQLWRETGEYLGLGVANVVNILNPRRVILGGGVVARSGDLLFDTVRRTVRERAMAQLADDVEIIPAELGEQAGIVGTVHLALERGLSG